MIDPTGPKPGRDRHPETNEPHFDQDDTGSEQPMYATEPENPVGSGDADNRGGAFGTGRDQSGQGEGGRNRFAQRSAESAKSGQAGAGGSWQQKAGRPADPLDGASEPAGREDWLQGDTAGDQALGARVDQLQAALAAAEAKAREAHEQHLRAVAEAENVRRRAQEDVAKAHKFAIESFAESMLPVRDSLEMALTVEVPSVESLREGVEATLRQLTQAFERNRVLEIDPLHQKFDPHLHQAISMAPSKDVAPNHVVSVLQKGYMINERILRPALVTVSQSG